MPDSPPYDDPSQRITMDEVEEQVAAVLEVDAKGISGRHQKELTPEEAQREAVKLNELLWAKGYDNAYIARWWNLAAFVELDGRTPDQAWGRGEYAKVRALAESLPSWHRHRAHS